MNGRKWLVTCAFAGALTAGAPARATWLEASSDHFVIDADTTPVRLRSFADRLERFDAALRTLYGVADDPARHADRVLILTTSRETIARLSSRGVGGFYVSRPGRSVIVTATLSPPAAARPEIGSNIPTIQSLDLDAQSTLLHEYSHHFMFVNFPRAYPMWFTEGFAEFNGNVSFANDGTIIVGTVPRYRAAGLVLGPGLPITELFAPSKRTLSDGARVDALYGRGWLLTHYLMVEGKRSDELNRYLDAINAGKPSLEAARSVFGDLDALNRTLDRLQSGGSLSARVVSVKVDPATITVAPLSPGAAATMPGRLRSKTGVTAQTAGAVADDAARRAAPFPADPRAQDALAEAAYDAGRDDVADAACDLALKTAPDDIDALLYKGRVAVRRAVKARTTDAATWKAARGWFVRANHLTPNAAEPLMLYYRSFLDAGAQPTETAYQGLLRAEQLAPESSQIRVLIARRLIDTGATTEARAMLAPVAYAPHGDKDDNEARTAIAALDAGRRDAAVAALAGATDDD